MASIKWRFVVAMLCHSAVMASESVVTTAVSVVELGRNNFTRALSAPDMSNGHCLIEFYAHWCPHCTHYKPVYERIGRFFNGDPRPQPYVWVLRVDCAIKQNVPVCDTYKIAGYPTILLGKAEEFLAEQIEKLIKIPPKEPVQVVEFIRSKLGMDYAYEEKSTLLHIQPTVGKRQESGKHFDVDDVERATVELFEHLFETTVILASTAVREAFIDWVGLLAMAHPSQRCRSSSRYVMTHIGILWPENAEHPLPLLLRSKICSVDYEKKEWGSCAGSIHNSRGFTCGLWQLLHALSVGIEETAANQWIKGTQAFAKYFFGCLECAKHFSVHLKEESAKSPKTRTELVMWLWLTHNKVNTRLAREELENGSGDPSFPKVQWPTITLCPNCRKGSSERGVEWNNQTVQDFLIRFYSVVHEPDSESRSGRKELITGTKEFVSTDVFSKEDATAIELKTAGSTSIVLYVCIALILIIYFTARKQRRRKLFPKRKDLL